MSKDKKGFTLIELLVVIAIIGILSAIVLASLNSARSKGKDASAIGSLSSIRSSAEIYYNGTDGNNSYTDMCTKGADVIKLMAAAKAQTGNDAGCVVGVNDSGASYEVDMLLNDETTFCVDGAGFAGRASATTADPASCVKE